MFRRELLYADDERLVAARTTAGAALCSGVMVVQPDNTGAQQQATRLAAWSLVHGFAALWREGVVNCWQGSDL